MLGVNVWVVNSLIKLGIEREIDKREHIMDGTNGSILMV
jgi:hypothetical protein